jgi:hypothetical protein
VGKVCEPSKSKTLSEIGSTGQKTAFAWVERVKGITNFHNLDSEHKMQCSSSRSHTAHTKAFCAWLEVPPSNGADTVRFARLREDGSRGGVWNAVLCSQNETTECFQFTCKAITRIRHKHVLFFTVKSYVIRTVPILTTPNIYASPKSVLHCNPSCLPGISTVFYTPIFLSHLSQRLIL